MDKFSISREEAIAKIYKHDISRKRYHNHYSDFKLGDSRNYDVCINSSRLGPQGTAEVLEAYIQKGL